jgi:hypothetical protein
MAISKSHDMKQEKNKNKKDSLDSLLSRKVAKELKGFVAISFRHEEDPALIDYYEAMRRAAQKANIPISLNRIDLKDGDFDITHQIFKEIRECHFIIADFTSNPHNVYYEVGFGRALRKKIIQTAREGTILYFDIRNQRTIFYKNATELENKLIPALKKIYQDILS